MVYAHRPAGCPRAPPRSEPLPVLPPVSVEFSWLLVLQVSADTLSSALLPVHCGFAHLFNKHGAFSVPGTAKHLTSV